MYTVILVAWTKVSFCGDVQASESKLNGTFHLRVTLSNRDWFVGIDGEGGADRGLFPPCDELMERHSSAQFLSSPLITFPHTPHLAHTLYPPIYTVAVSQQWYKYNST